MAFIKLTKSQNIIDNIDKIQPGDLLYIRMLKSQNLVWRKCFLYGSALGVESYEPPLTKSKRKVYNVYMLAGGVVYVVQFMSVIRKNYRRDPNGHITLDFYNKKTMKLMNMRTYQDFFSSSYQRVMWKGLGL